MDKLRCGYCGEITSGYRPFSNSTLTFCDTTCAMIYNILLKKKGLPPLIVAEKYIVNRRRGK